MRSIQLLITCVFSLVIVSTTVSAGTVFVTSQDEFDDAHDNAAMDDSIVWRAGVYSDIFMDITKDHLFITTETLGSTIFDGASRVNITSDYITLEGFQFLNGDIGTRDVINTTGSYNKFTQLNIRAYTSYKYLRVREASRYVEIAYCNFENRLNLDDQNILSILVDDTNPGYHKIQHCSFKNFEGTGNDLGIEPIRIGLSTQADHISRTLVEYCYFTQCDGDGELISSKASQNVYRFNTFENNTKAELVLRHGSEAIVYGNFFLNGKGGVRVREGQNHYIYNNYFSGLDDRTIFLQNNSSDRLDNINVAFNTVVDCSEVILGGDGGNRPTNVTFSNNIFTNPDDDLFEDATGTETWIGNVAFGDLGISLPENGLTMIDPMLEANGMGFMGLAEDSPVIDAALSGYAFLPQFEGMDAIDTEVLFDLMGQGRPALIEERDLGANEFPHTVLIQPIATEENTGPSYNTSTTTAVNNTIISVNDLIGISPNPVADQINVAISSRAKIDITVDIFDLEGRRVSKVLAETGFSGKRKVSKGLQELPLGSYTIRALGRDAQADANLIQIIKFIKIQ